LGEIPTLQMKEHCHVLVLIHKSKETIVTEMTIQRKGVRTYSHYDSVWICHIIICVRELEVESRNNEECRRQNSCRIGVDNGVYDKKE